MIVDLLHARDPKALQSCSRAQRARLLIAKVAQVIVARSGRAEPALTLYGPDYDALAAEHPEGVDLYWGRVRLIRHPDPDFFTVY